MIQPTFSVCLALLCITAAWAGPTCSKVGQLYSLGQKEPQVIEEFRVEVLQFQPSSPNGCNAQGRLQITFPKLTNSENIYRLKVEFSLDRKLKGRTFHVADELYEIGAEVFSNNRWLTVKKDHEISATKVTMTIGREYTRIEGIKPTFADTNFSLVAKRDLFIGVNRGIDSEVRGEGLCDIKIYVLKCSM